MAHPRRNLNTRLSRRYRPLPRRYPAGADHGRSHGRGNRGTRAWIRPATVFPGKVLIIRRVVCTSMRIVLVSDTHGLHDSVRIPDGDILIHAGDLTSSGEVREVAAAAKW